MSDDGLTVRRRTQEELRTLARQTIQGEVMVCWREHEIKSAFYMMVAITTISAETAEQVGAFIGYAEHTVRGRGMNGYPIFTAMSLLHKDDLPIFDEIYGHMMEALQ